MARMRQEHRAFGAEPLHQRACRDAGLLRNLPQRQFRRPAAQHHPHQCGKDIRVFRFPFSAHILRIRLKRLLPDARGAVAGFATELRASASGTGFARLTISKHTFSLNAKETLWRADSRGSRFIWRPVSTVLSRGATDASTGSKLRIASRTARRLLPKPSRRSSTRSAAT